MSTLKARLEADLRESMKARDDLVTSTLRMAIAAIRTAEVSGTRKHELTDEEILEVLKRETKKRREAAEAYAEAGRAAAAEKERAEERILARYMPKQLSDEELAQVVGDALAAGGFTSKAQMGPAMKAAMAAVAGRADGSRVAAEVQRRLS